MSGHERDCKMRLAFHSAAPIECEHGYDACPICDPCTCGKRPTYEEALAIFDAHIARRKGGA